ncbi:Putative zinc ribbon domain-containing protein [Formosa sp. Hel1_31_208]|uniref:zinc ribbon domain-containing protein n=1 Tax=Formosa sp. Hel1_31_208 TaxID=1798225 RepID=UPI00087B6F74|nr:zinc ribbon domain-containing protein [Formosa sp. Hel1_31_208]SDS18456.1 Putative zinc ribbon domain-containing protein [Formosa sp. Hel1_31_208]
MTTSKTYKFCQSCGMPIKQDSYFGETNLDGSKNHIYCSFCYENGAFTINGTAKEMDLFCKEQMVENESLKFLAWLLTRGIPRLERWKNT